MKKYFAILLFVCLAAKPAYNIGYVTYFELNIDYIVEKYCVNKDTPVMKCNGKCHLAKQLSFTQKSETSNNKKAIANGLSDAFFPVYFETFDEINPFYSVDDESSIFWEVSPENYLISLSVTSPPPQV